VLLCKESIFACAQLSCKEVDIGNKYNLTIIMGCGGTKVFVANEKKIGQDARALEDFQKLQLTPQEINTFYTAFCKMDKDGSGHIEIAEFMKSLDLEMTPMSNEVFSELDKSHDGHSDFREFTLAAWKFCAKGLDSVSDLAFDIYDEDDSNALTKVEIKNMIIEIYGKVSPKHDVQSILNEFDIDGSASISRSEFKEMVKKNKNIILPALTFQVQISLMLILMWHVRLTLC
jgi:Ca2+-binding EF-hand superfamily protein